MKLGIDCHHIEDQRGIGRYVLALLKEWVKEGYLAGKEHEIICYFKKPLLEIDQLPKEVKAVYTKSISTTIFQQLRLPFEAKRDKLDVLFSPSYLLPFFYMGKSVVMIHDIIYSVLPDEFDWRSRFDRIYLPLAARTSAQKATFVLTPSQFTKNEIIRCWRLNPLKIFITPLAGDIEHTTKPVSTPKSDFVLYVGSLFNRRHGNELIRAFYSLIKTHPTLRLIMIGKDHTQPPQHLDQLIAKVNHNVGRQAIVRKGWVSEGELTSLYAQARALVLLSDYEGFGLPVLEALSQGIPVLTTKHGSLLEIVGDAALFVNNPLSIQEINKKLLAIISDTVLRKRLKQAGLEQARRFTWKATAKKTWEILELATKV